MQQTSELKNKNKSNFLEPSNFMHIILSLALPYYTKEQWHLFIIKLCDMHDMIIQHNYKYIGFD